MRTAGVVLFTASSSIALTAFPVLAQDEEGVAAEPVAAEPVAAEPVAAEPVGESPLQVNGMLRLQGGMFFPGPSDKFRAHANRAFAPNPTTGQPDPSRPCDPVIEQTNACIPTDHGQAPGSPSIGRATFQMEAQWDIDPQIGLHAIVRAVRSMRLPADRYAQVPNPALDPALRKSYAEGWAHDNYYSEFDLRELYLDLNPKRWLSFRLGRQQVAWGDTGQYRLLDIVNPSNNTWHFAPLEAIEDTRIPLWMGLAAIDIPRIDHTLELLWIPMLDRPQDTVATPLTFVGAWGLPYSNTPTSFFIEHREFQYPGQRIEDMRGGLRWKGNLGQHTSYSVVYMYTHQQSPPIPLFYELKMTASGGFDSTNAERAVLVFPRQHIAGFSLERSVDALATVARLEAAVEPNRTYPGDTRQPLSSTDGRRFYFRQSKEVAINYAVVLQRPTMMRFLNPTQNFLLVFQFMHSYVPTLSEADIASGYLRETPGYNNWKAQQHTFRLIFAVRTTYRQGLINLGLTGGYFPNAYGPDSGFYSIDVGFRIGPRYRLNVTATDFFGGDPYRELGLFRDRDELAAGFSVLF